jgi:RimJ/RimL family protein N-acetyltransferase/GNAT superfamily N-acetyltransferase
VNIEQFDPKSDEQRLRACYELVLSGQVEDDPNGPPLSFGMFLGWWAYGFSGEPREVWLASAADGEPLGCYLLELPNQENTTIGFLWPQVSLVHRRRGIGAALVAHAAGRAEQAGRTMLQSDVRTGSPGAEFAIAAEARTGLQAARRVLDYTPELVAGLPRRRAEAEAHADGYALRYFTGPVPDDLVEQNCALERAMADAPHEDWFEPPEFDADRIRTIEARLLVQGLRRYSIAAMHEATGEMAALTQLVIDPDVDGWAFQEVTAVTRPHRGHRLGKLVKIAMLQQIAELEPHVRQIVTFNAVDNEHMIAVNDELGHRVTDIFQGYELDVSLARTLKSLSANSVS